MKKFSLGYSMLEVLIASSITATVGGLVFGAMANFMVISGQDEVAQRVHYNLLLSLSKVKRELNVATNVVPSAGGHNTANGTLVLRVPRFDANEVLVPDEFDYVVLTITATPGSTNSSGLVMERFDEIDDDEPMTREVLDPSAIAFGCSYGVEGLHGVTGGIQEISNLTEIREVEVALLRMVQTGFSPPEYMYDYYQGDLFEELAWFREMIDYGMEFRYVREIMHYINESRMDVLLDTSSTAATMRNRRTMGLKDVAPPILETSY